jgi:serine/threonine protein kinase
MYALFVLLHTRSPPLTSFLVLHDLHLIHTDLKPENILLVHNDYKTVPLPPAKVSVPWDISGVF